MIGYGKQIRIVVLAQQCKIRTKDWGQIALKVIQDRAFEYASKHSKEIAEEYVMTGISYAGGSTYQAISDAISEYKEYGIIACKTVSDASLSLLDLLSKEADH